MLFDHSLFQVAPERLAQLNRGLRGMKLGNFEFCSSELRLGALHGNRFEVVMRNIEGADRQQARCLLHKC